MSSVLPRLIDTKYENILAEERALARKVAAAVIPTPSLSVWEVMIPPIFLINFLRLKRARETMALNFLFTKKLALKAALTIIDQGKTEEEVKEELKGKTGDILAADKKGVYSAKIRQKQMKEMELLLRHYLRLLTAEGRDYQTMVKNAYLSQESYLNFLAELEEAERDVYRAAVQTVKTPSAREIAQRMEDATCRIRRIDAAEIYQGNIAGKNQ